MNKRDKNKIHAMGKGCPQNVIDGCEHYYEMRIARDSKDNVLAEIERIFNRWRENPSNEWRVRNFVERAK